ncbi:AprI/Inh family metalloprotease inhibitor [Siculibacillus lacustris]|nr:AprI/Inh family metalloprotease inhibitor [Siculibacillus lacustris]
MIRGKVLVLAVVTAAALAGCGRLGLSDSGSRRVQPVQQTFEPLPAAPTATVTQDTLQPLPPAGPAAGAPIAGAPVDPMAPPAAYPGAAPLAPGAAKPAQVAEAAPEKGMPVVSGDFTGGWGMTTPTDHCQLSASTTAWAGGSRVSSRGCTSPDLQKISAWVIADNRIVLKGSDGSIVGTVAKVAKDRFVGQTSTRQTLSLSR